MYRQIIVCSSISLIFIFGCRKDETDLWYKECCNEITSVTRANYYNDAVQFGIQRLGADTLTDYHLNPVYRAEEAEYVLGKLSAIYNYATTLQEGDPIYDLVFKYQIHKATGVSLNKLILVVENWEVQSDFFKNFGNTGNEFLDLMASEHGFVAKYQSWFIDSTYIIIESEQDYVMSHFAKQLKGTPGILYARSPQNYYYENNMLDITYSWTEEYDEFVFIYGMGDCPAGCTEFHYWQVRVDKNCNVELISEYGDPLPG